MASKIKVELRNEDKALVASMLEAIKTEAGVRTSAEQAMLEAGVSAWSKCRDTIHGIIERKHTPEEKKAAKEAGEALVPSYVIAGYVLDALRTASEEAAATDAKMNRGKQYASDLRRAVKVLAKDGKIPAALWRATRSQWNDSPVWQEAGILAKSGKKKGQTSQSGGNAQDGEEGDVAQAALKADPELSELMTIVATLVGPFRSEFLTEAKELALRIAKKQGASTGSGDAAKHAVG